MSLIHEALRKARHEASHQDDPGVVFPGGLTGRGRQSGVRAGMILGIAVTVIAGAIIGGGLWWTLRQTPGDAVPTKEPTGRATVHTPVPEPASPQPSPLVAETGPFGVPAADQGPVDDNQAQSVQTNKPVDSDGAQPATATSQNNNAEVEEPPAAPATQPATASGEREYMVEADLGYASLALDYIMVSPTESFAQINGLEVRIGGTIEGFTVEEITEDWVKMRDDRGPLVLRVPSSP